MARRTRLDHEEHGLLEVDAFAAAKEQILLDSAGKYATQPSDEELLDQEVMAIHHSQDEDQDDENASLNSSSGDDVPDDNNWGSRLNYYGGDDPSDNDNDEDAVRMTEEALRQQKRHLKELAIDDYVSTDMLESWEKSAADLDGPAVSNLDLSAANPASLDPDMQKQLLALLFPEFTPLLRELALLLPLLNMLSSRSPLDLVNAQSAALRAYLAAVASYFALFTDKLASDSFESFSMKNEPVMETILRAREVWRQASELQTAMGGSTLKSSSYVGGNQENQHSVSSALGEEDIDGNGIDSEDGESDDVENGELRSQEFDSESIESPDIDSESIESHDIDSDDIDNQEGTLPTTRPPSRDNLGINIDEIRSIKKAPTRGSGDYDYVESAAPDAVDAEDKSRRRRTLRFYTSKIDQAAAKRERTVESGDADLPYRERLFERQQRLLEEARRRGMAPATDDTALGGGDDDAMGNTIDETHTHLVNDEDAAYYQEIASGKRDARSARAHAHAVAVKAAKEGKLAEAAEELGEDGKRAINYQILKNKGLTPHRKKENRNSRVKKRMQYEKAKKKLLSVRQVYKGDAGPYEGEKTGIKKGISRSVKLV